MPAGNDGGYLFDDDEPWQDEDVQDVRQVSLFDSQPVASYTAMYHAGRSTGQGGGQPTGSQGYNTGTTLNRSVPAAPSTIDEDGEYDEAQVRLCLWLYFWRFRCQPLHSPRQFQLGILSCSSGSKAIDPVYKVQSNVQSNVQSTK